MAKIEGGNFLKMPFLKYNQLNINKVKIKTNFNRLIVYKNI